MKSIALIFHILAVVIWVGGMFFSYVLLRPALDTTEESQRLTIWVSTLKKFFSWVWFCIAVLLVSGFSMVYQSGGFSSAGIPVFAMMALTLVMSGIFKFTWVGPYRHMCRGVEQEKWEVARYAFGTIKLLFAVNLGLGAATIAIAYAARF
jgi:uncharacterized membrane protein